MRGNMEVRFGGAGPGKETSRNGGTAPRSDPYQHLRGRGATEPWRDLFGLETSTGTIDAIHP